MVGSGWKRVRALPTEKKALILALIVFACLAFYRFYSYWTSGFFVSDEYGYFYDAVHGRIYGDRWFFGWLNILLFRTLGIQSVDSFSYFLPFYILFWSSLTIVCFYKIIRALGYDGSTVAISILSSLGLVSFVLLSLGFLTEPVGLSMAMVGIYFLVRFMKSKTAGGLIAFPIFSALSFSAAAGTREPYNALLVAGLVVVLVIVLSRRRERQLVGCRPFKTILSLALTLSFVSTIVLLEYPTHALTHQVLPLSYSMLKSITSNPSTSVSVTPSGTVISTPATQQLINVPFYRSSPILNTFLIFIGGVLIGWGPVCFSLGVAGLILVMKRSIRGERGVGLPLVVISLSALGSYLVVSYIFAPNPYYFSFQNYSTIIRFSDTALPAYFLTVPAVISVISKSRRRTMSLLAVFIVFLLVSVPVYQTYASSNLNRSGDPFSPSYKTAAAQIRDYISAHQGDVPFYIVGLPYGWVFTPGVDHLRETHVYSISPSPVAPSINYAGFVEQRWSTFYVYEGGNFSQTRSEAPYLLPLLGTQSDSNLSNASLPYSLVGRQVVLQGDGYVLLRIQLSWH